MGDAQLSTLWPPAAVVHSTCCCALQDAYQVLSDEKRRKEYDDQAKYAQVWRGPPAVTCHSCWRPATCPARLLVQVAHAGIMPGT
jgi:hypothetical protein